MIFNQCANCGRIHETATISLNNLKKQIDDKIYEWKWSDPDELVTRYPTLNELSSWSDKLREILQEI